MKELKCKKCGTTYYASVVGWLCPKCEVELEEVREESK